jgi:hypothetical protein
MLIFSLKNIRGIAERAEPAGWVRLQVERAAANLVSKHNHRRWFHSEQWMERQENVQLAIATQNVRHQNIQPVPEVHLVFGLYYYTNSEQSFESNIRVHKSGDNASIERILRLWFLRRENIPVWVRRFRLNW